MKNLIFSLFLISILFGCGTSKQLQGDILNNNYTADIPFQFIDDMILVEVVIDGSTYTFMFDTGAELNVIDQSIADKLENKRYRSLKVNGSAGNRKKIPSVVIPSLQLGELDVEGSVAIITDLSSISKFLGCLNIRGIIGNNVMHRANMKIDYENQIITFSDQDNLFKPSEKAHQYKMNSGRSGNVKLKMTIGESEKYLTFDTGFSGNIKVNDTSLLKNNVYIKSQGVTSASLHQVNRGVSNYVYINQATIANIPVEKQVITVNDNGSSLLGNKFLSNFNIIVDWEKDLIFFDPFKSILPDTLEFLELIFIPDYHKSKIEILKIMTDITSFDESILGWQVDKINGKDVTQFDNPALCTYWNEASERIKTMDKVNLQISKENETRDIVVKRVNRDQMKN